MRDYFLKLLRHMAWADRRIESALQANRQDPGKTAEALRLYAHIVGAERIWLARLKGGDSFVNSLFPDWDIAACAAESQTALADYERYIRGVEDFGQMIAYRNSKGECLTSVEDILTHVFMHGSYHRGQINTRLRNAGIEPVPVDYIVYARS